MRTRRIAARMTRRLDLPRSVFYATLFAAAVVGMTLTACAEPAPTAVQSLDGRNSIVLRVAGDAAEHVRFTVNRDGSQIIRPSLLGPVLAAGRSLGDGARIVDVHHGKVNESFQLPWGKTGTVSNCCSYAVVTLATPFKVSLAPGGGFVAIPRAAPVGP